MAIRNNVLPNEIKCLSSAPKTEIIEWTVVVVWKRVSSTVFHPRGLLYLLK